MSNLRFLGWLIVILLGACTAAPPPGESPTTVLPVVSPVVSGSPTVGATVLPLPTATPLARLPAPLYLIEQDQIARLEPDGSRMIQITYEAQPVRELSVAANGTLVYLTGDELVALDGAGRRLLLRAPGLSNPRIAPDGQLVAYHLADPAPGLIVGRDDSPGGVYLSAITGGRPSLLMADDPEPATPDFANPAWRYMPVAWSPDGSRLLLYAVMLPEMGIPGGEAVIVHFDGSDKLMRAPSCCEEEVWSVDGSELTVAGGGPAPDIRFGLYRIDAASGVETAVLTADETTVPLARAPQRLADGIIYAFVELVSWSDYNWDYPFRPVMARVNDAGNVTTARPERLGEPLLVLWDPQARGAVVKFAEQEHLIWLPTDPALPPLTTAATGFALAWTPDADPAARDCSTFASLTIQPAERRQFDPGVADLQGRLAALGYDPGPIDGLFGPATAAAVGAFRAAAGLPEGEFIDCAAWQALFARSIAP